MRPTHELVQTPLFKIHSEGLLLNERIALTYERAKAIGAAYGLTAMDLLTLSPKFWQLHTDPIWSVDGAAGTLVTLQYNCCAGTLAMFARTQPELRPILQQVLDFDISGQYCLTELGHGLDVINLETTATLLSSGEFEINTPHEGAANTGRTAMFAVVFARAFINEEDRGVKPFLIKLNDGKNMSPGIMCKLLPQRGGSRPVNHSLTSFHNVRIPYSALLGTAAKPTDLRTAFFANIARVAVGTIAIGSLGLPALQVSAFIAAKYSNRRIIVDAEGTRKPIMAFQTQKIPILTALAQSFVMKAFHDKAVSIFCQTGLDHACATGNLTLGDRCGAQGLFEVNQLTAMHADMRGTAIAEGDLLGISILPTQSLLAQHERGLLSELRSVFAEIKDHRSPEYNQRILPELMPLIQAMGHRIAFEAASAAQVEPCLLDLYVASCVKLDPAWYVEKLGLTRRAQQAMEQHAIAAVYPRLEDFLDRMHVEPYITAPLVSDERWKAYLGTLKTYGSPSGSQAEDWNLTYKAFL
ncbi:acyl-CoA dehydrogenase NM domain-like protein [Mycena leptocephala]|nr:acyl-CoA dehydrogenase NM domain-like protein [Mycena leptocephala]